MAKEPDTPKRRIEMMKMTTDISRLRFGRRALPLVALLAIAPLAACGQPDDELDGMAVDEDAAMDTTPAGTPAPPSPAAIADDQTRVISVELREWAVELSRDTVPAGEMTFQAMNAGTMEHALEVEGQGVEQETEHIAPGGTATLTVRLRPGTYEVYCPVVGQYDHQAQGMTTTLVVTDAAS
jgi:uncharacterized cupredoxin-like copper-binding protein